MLTDRLVELQRILDDDETALALYFGHGAWIL